MKKSKADNLEARLMEARQDLIKNFKDGAIVPPEDIGQVEVISTGSIMLDAVLGTGGWVRGRINELYGKQSSGKSTLALAACAEALKLGEPVLYLDHEHTFDASYASVFGISVNNPLFMLGQPVSLEQGAKVAEHMLDEELASVVVFDSIAAMISESEAAAEIGQVLVAPQARALNAAMRRLIPKVFKSKAIVLCVNHIRDQIGVYSPGVEKSTTTPGGTALHYYASMRVKVSYAGKIAEGSGDKKIVVGTRHIAEVSKNKFDTPYDKAKFVIRGGYGLCDYQTVAELAESFGFIERSGPVYVVGEQKISGMGALISCLKEDLATYEDLRSKVYQKLVETPRRMIEKTNPFKLEESDL